VIPAIFTENNMVRKVLALDIDGTLTNSKKEITPRTAAAIKKIAEAGHVVAIASGRPTPGIRDACETLELKRYGGYGISFNGARTLDLKSGVAVDEKTLPPWVLRPLADYAKEHGAGLMTYEGDTAVTEGDTDDYMRLEARINKIGLKKVKNLSEYVTFPVNKCLMTAPEERAAKMERELSEIYEGKLSIYRSEPFFVEVMPYGVNKATALEALIKSLNIGRENLICCGDGYNDLSMIEYAGVGVAMGNALQIVKDAADFVTGTNDNDGLISVIQKYIMEV